MNTNIFKFTTFTYLKVVILLGVLSHNYTYSQNCGFIDGEGCTNTNYDNSFMRSNNDASTIEYDNFVSTYHGSAVRTFDGTFRVWGERMANNGTDNVLSPLELNSTNYPALGSAKVYKVSGGSAGSNTSQYIALTSDGLYAWGNQGFVLAGGITTSNTFQKISIGGNPTGLPSGVTPNDVKMMVASVNRNSSLGALMIVTCSGNLWAISQIDLLRGNGNSGNSNNWYQVTTNQVGNPPLTNVVAARLSGQAAIALRADGTLWTWGLWTYLGDNTTWTNRNRATQMVLPSSETIKMIGVNTEASGEWTSYYVLMTNGNMYSLGGNNERQLGDFTTTERRSWVQPRYSSGGQVMNNIKWISPSESDGRYAGVNVINEDSTLYAFGRNSLDMIGRNGGADDPGIPNGLTINDKITSVKTGGHTTMIVNLCESNFGYVGHRVRGSMGNGSADDATENSYTYATALVPICGTASPDLTALPPILTGPTGNFCVNEPVILEGTPSGGTYSIQSGPGVLSGNILNFTAVGDVSVRYTLPVDICTGDSEFIDRVFSSEICCVEPSINISGTSDVCQNDSSPNITINATGGTPPYVITYNINGAANQTVNLASDGSIDISVPTNQLGLYTYNLVSVVYGSGGPSCTQPSISGSASISVNGISSAGSIASIQTICIGETPATFTSVAPASGTGVINYQWQSSTNNGVTWNNISGATNLTYTSGALSQPTQFRRLAYVDGCIILQQSSNVITIDIINTTDLSILKSVNNVNPDVGENVVFTLTVTNNGPCNDSGVTVSDLLPSGFTYVSHTGPGTYSPVTGNWNIGNLAVSSSVSLEITATVNTTGNYINIATVTGDTPDSDITNNISGVQVVPNCVVRNLVPNIGN